MVNINTELFRRTAPQTKLNIIENLSDSELLSATKDTIIRIVKEVGKNRRLKGHDKDLFIPREIRVGNNWNSEVTSLSYYKGKLYIDCYVQYSNTDATEVATYEDFFSAREFLGTKVYNDRYGNAQTSCYRYNRKDQANVMRAILKTYIYENYPEKVAIKS